MLLLAAALLLVLGARAATGVVSLRDGVSVSSDAAMHALGLLLLGIALLATTVKYGSKLVDRPQLRRDLAQPWK